VICDKCAYENRRTPRSVRAAEPSWRACAHRAALRLVRARGSAASAAQHCRCQVSGLRFQPPTPDTQKDPLSYTPKHLADKILQSKSTVEGERKQVAVLFADVKGSMELAEQLDPEQWHTILDRFSAGQV